MFILRYLAAKSIINTCSSRWMGTLGYPLNDNTMRPDDFEVHVFLTVYNKLVTATVHAEYDIAEGQFALSHIRFWGGKEPTDEPLITAPATVRIKRVKTGKRDRIKWVMADAYEPIRLISYVGGGH